MDTRAGLILCNFYNDNFIHLSSMNIDLTIAFIELVFYWSCLMVLFVGGVVIFKRIISMLF